MPTLAQTSATDPLLQTVGSESNYRLLDRTARASERQSPGSGTFTPTLLGRLEDFLAAWQDADAPPSPRDFLPSGRQAGCRSLLVQFLMADLEYRYRRGCPKRLEAYAAEFPELAAGGLPCELIFEEYQVRRAHGEQVEPAEYFFRFPGQVEELQRWFALAAPAEGDSGGSSGQRGQPVNEGDRLDEFQLLSLLGEGAFGRVFLARQTSMQRLVALKVSADRGAEPQTLAQLDHPNIVRVYDQRRLEERGLRLLYMQYVAGGTLQAVVRRVRETAPEDRRGALLFQAVDEAVERGGQPAMSGSEERRKLAGAGWAEVVCRLGAQLALALDYAHERGVLHRDVKPANVLLAADGSPKLADFNVSISAHLEDRAGAADFGGSLAYMSPEQLRACHSGLDGKPDELDPRSDIYSLGVLLWELLRGQRPFEDRMSKDGWEATVETMLEARRATPVPPTAGDDPVAAGLDDVLQRCLAPDPKDRFASARQLARELRLCLNARAREILREPPRGVRKWAQKHPMWSGVVVGYASHGVVLAFAALYIHYAIIQKMPADQQRLWNIQIAIAAIVGTVAGLWAMWRCGREVSDAMTSPLHQIRDPQQMATVRRQALGLALKAKAIAIRNWSVSGVLYVVVQTVLTGQLSFFDCLNILGCHIVCGSIALVYPVLGGAVASIRSYYPALVERSPGEINDTAELTKLAAATANIVPLAGFIPIFGLLWLALGLDNLAGTPRAVATGFVGLAGLVAIPAAYAMSRTIQADLAALIRAAPGHEA